jgi:hypothetical protein
LHAAETDGGKAAIGVLLAEVLALRAVLLNVMFRTTNGGELTGEEGRT